MLIKDDSFTDAKTDFDKKNATNQRMLANVIRKVKKGSVSVN